MIYITPHLETERLTLKRGNIDDYKKVYEYDFRKLRDINGEFEFVKLDEKELEGFVPDNLENAEEYDWIIYLKDGTPIGNIIADREVEELKAIELAFNLHPTYWGQGYMKEACISVIDFLFNNGFENILCGYDEGNKKSQRLGEKMGFELYSIEKDSWIKDGIPISVYMTILSKKDFYKMHDQKIHKRILIQNNNSDN